MVTDMPGYYYAPYLFALVNVAVVPIVGTALMLRSAHAETGRAPQRLRPNER
jgi:hypothetical protein